MNQDNWQQIHNRLLKAQAQLTGEILPPPAEQEKILKDRARALAQPPPHEPDKRDEIAFLAFQLDGEQYGFESTFVREVLTLQDVTPLPTVPAFIAGIIHFRGQILTLLDLRALFGMPRPAPEGPQYAIILHHAGTEVGVLAQRLSGIQHVQRDQLQAPLPALSKTGAKYLKGLTPERLALLDARQLLSDPALHVLEEVAES